MYLIKNLTQEPIFIGGDRLGEYESRVYSKVTEGSWRLAARGLLQITEVAGDSPDLGTLTTAVSDLESDVTSLQGQVSGMFDGVGSIRRLTQAQYDALSPPNATTVYIIVG